MLARRGASGGRVLSKGGAGVTAPVVGRIGTAGTGSMHSEGEVARGGRGLHAVGAGRGTVSGIGCERAKP